MKLGIIGGVGPITGVDLLNKIILNSSATCDNDHVPTVLYSLPSCVKNRTDAFFGKNIEPAVNVNKLIKTFLPLKITHVAITCNTLHISVFFDAIKKNCIDNNLHLYSLVEEAINYLQSKTDQTSYLLLATKATFLSRLYHVPLKHDNRIISISDNDIETIDQTIRYFTADLRNHIKYFNDILKIISKYKFDSIILGCTELSYLFSINNYSKCIDPLDLLAKKIIFDYERS